MSTGCAELIQPEGRPQESADRLRLCTRLLPAEILRSVDQYPQHLLTRSPWMIPAVKRVALPFPLHELDLVPDHVVFGRVDVLQQVSITSIKYFH